MALQIKQNHDMVEVLGDLNSQNANMLKHHFKCFFKKVDRIFLNLDNVTTIAPGGAYTMEQLYLEFMKSNRAIYIIGRENTAIAQVMKATQTSYILSDDRI